MKHVPIILGGGLWGGLLAHRWHALYPEVPFLLVEARETFGGNHTWSFHDSDLKRSALEWLKPFIEKTWPSYEVRFPEFNRVLDLPYHSMTSEKFHEVLLRSLPENRYRLQENIDLEEALLRAPWVIDARGLYFPKETGWQKFLGKELVLMDNHNLPHPVLMDCLIPQTDGFRFLYLLPFDEKRILVELTSYSNDPEINEREYEEFLSKVISEKGWRVDSVRRVEKASLPIPIKRSEEAPRENVSDFGGIFHDTTGYSLPDAVRVIEALLEAPPEQKTFAEALKNYRQDRRSDRAFFRLLNRFMFKASGPGERYRMLQFFYKHDPLLISHFYAGKMSTLERLRFFLGKPPISLTDALREVLR